MTAHITNDLLWRGAGTVEAVAQALNAHADVAVHLPANFHHAVVACFRPSPSSTLVEEVDVRGGAELLARLSAVRGLENIAALTEPVAHAHAQVRIVSPSPTIAIRCSDETAQ